jgi:4-hydroxybenzoate polyprenyltransferase
MKNNPLIYAIKAARPLHWVKNLSLFAGILFTGTLFIPSYQKLILEAFLIFCLITSSGYLFNDIIDAPKDRLHPTKKNRPIASGKLPLSLAFIEAGGLATLALILANSVNELFFISVLTYILIQVVYSLFLKNTPIIDILAIASGFVIRVYAGAFAINAHLSVWFLLCVVSVALFLASGKRRAELSTISNAGETTRKSLSKYTKELLNSYVTMFGNAAWMSWALFTFFESPKAALPVWLVLAELSKATTINKLLMITIPVAIFGIMRYESLIFEEKSEAPEKVLLSDIPLIFSVFLWVGIVVWVLYSGVSI